jgi:serine/threonine protein kinase
MNEMIGKNLGKYQIVEQLGEGGMATVYKAYDQALERYVAIKVIRTASMADPLFLGRFEREAKALAKLDHPYILKVLDYGEQDGVPYLVMPYVGQGTLKQYTSAQLPYERAITIIIPVAEALSYAHKRHIIHRDVKPANILFGESGEPILSDFGIAKMLDAGEQTQLTGTGLGIGTPAYMAPEQWNGIADERTDVYALGIVLYELLTSRCPFQAETPAAILIKQVQDPLPRPRTFAPELPENVEAVIFKALAKDPSLRFQTMEEFIHGLKDVLYNKSSAPTLQQPIAPDQQATMVAPRPPAPVMPLPMMTYPPRQEKKKWLPLAIGGGGLVVVAVMVLFLVFGLPKLKSITSKEKTPVVTSIAGNGIATPRTQTNTQEAVTGSSTQATTGLSGTTGGQNPGKSVTTIEKLPVDIPVFAPNNGDVITSESQGSLMIAYSTSSVQKEVQDYFLTEMKKNGWELIATTDMSAQNMILYAFSKDSSSVMVNIMAMDSNNTYIQVVLDGSK